MDTSMKQTKRSNIIAVMHKSIMVIAVLAVMIGVVPIQSVKTSFRDDVISALFSKEDADGILVSEDGSGFPVIENASPRYPMWVVATAYSSDPRQTDASPCTPALQGFDMCWYYEQYGQEDTIATNFLPLGTHVKFPDLFGDRVFVVRDRMNARYNGTRRVDIWIGSSHPESQEIIQEAKQKAKTFGVKRVKMEVYYK